MDDKVIKSGEAKKNKVRPRRLCRICGIKISLWHCAETGCVWCSRCSARLRAK